jgi:hypothetical protein
MQATAIEPPSARYIDARRTGMSHDLQHRPIRVSLRLYSLDQGPIHRAHDIADHVGLDWLRLAHRGLRVRRRPFFGFGRLAGPW